ncbi:E3 ubiquitin-protein ligase HECTD3-like isoform 4-T4 [Morphnus guianensis]
MRAGGEAPHQVLGRLRFLLQCSECFRRARALPAALCYVPREVQYKICKDPAAAAAAAAARSLLSVWDSPGPARGGKRAARATIEVRKGGCLRATGEEYCNGAGLWVKLSKEQLEEYTSSRDLAEGWLLAQRFGEGGDKLVPVDSVEKIQWQHQTLGVDYKPAVSWEQVVDLTYSMRLGEKPRLAEQDEAAVQKFRSVPPGWSYEHDMELGRFLYDHRERERQCGDCTKEHLSSVEVSSQTEDGSATHLTDNQTYTFWESNGPPGQHWVRLNMKKGTIVKKLWLMLDGQASSYVPRRVAVYGGAPNRLQHLRTVLINENSFQDVCILRDMKIHLPVLEIRILECRGEPVLPDWGCQLSPALNLQLVPAPAALPAALAAFWGLLEEKLGNELHLGCHRCWGLLAPTCSTRALPATQLQLYMQHHCPFLADQGYNVRLRGIKIKSFWEWDLILNADMFQPARLVRYPLLEGVNTDVLYRRAVVIQRFVQLLDSVLCYLIPLSEDSVGTFNALRSMKPFLLLSKQSTALITHCLQSSESTPPHTLPKLYINRHLAREHRTNPALDPSCKNTVFTQLYEGLRSSKNNQPLDYRWPLSYSQWWECEFITEGIIDYGGGFRDSLSDVSEELCPSSGDVAVPLPFFVRTSNQGNSSSDTRDLYVPNPSCRDFPKYEWIGQLMGAALRSKEFLILALPVLVWKQLAGEEVSWSKDFATVDSELVKLLEVLEGVDREAFEFMFGRELTYTIVRSDQRVVELIPNGSSTVVRYEDRKEFIRLVQKARLEESKEQIAAMRAGLLRVVPQPVLDLLTWQQLEKKVCGDPEITVAELRRFITFEDFPSDDTRIQNFLEALNNFTSEDLSRFLKFVTGRSRLPVQITVYPERENLNALDLMPQASTCSCSFFLPNYSSAKACEELLRYAVYNCMSIDTDKNPWDE